MSANAARAAAVVDAGLKAVSLDSGPPIVDPSWSLLPPGFADEGGDGVNSSGGSSGGGSSSGNSSSGGGGGGAVKPRPLDAAPEYKAGGDEHGVLLFPHQGAVHALGAPRLPRRGTLLRLQPGHCDPTTNLFDWVVAARGGRVEAVWRVAGRGPGA